MEHRIIIREMNEQDVTTVARFWNALAIDQLSQDKYYKSDLLSIGKIDQSQYYKKCLNSSRCKVFVVCIDGEICGFSEIWIYEKDFYFDIENYGYILHFFIEKEARSYAAASKLFDKSEEWVRKQGIKFLGADVFGFNVKVQKLLQHKKMDIYKMRFMKPLQ